MGIAWIIGFSIYFTKRYKRKKLNRKVAAGTALPKKKPPKIPDQKIIIPPDPAILLGHRLPGESAFQGDNDAGDEHHSKSESKDLPVSLDNTGSSTTNSHLPTMKSL